jgi:hypothetical protein
MASGQVLAANRLKEARMRNSSPPRLTDCLLAFGIYVERESQ